MPNEVLADPRFARLDALVLGEGETRVVELLKDWPVMVSRQYGDANIWPGDTFGISMLPGGRVALSWGSAVGGSQNSAIWTTVVKVAASG